MGNQSGVRRGLFSIERLREMNARLQVMFEAAGAHLEAIYFCPHTPEHCCDCRKRALGLMRRASTELAFVAASAVVIGDKQSDVEFERLAGSKTILIDPTSRHAPESSKATLIATDFWQAAQAAVAL